MLTAIAIDDEPKALEIIQLHSNKVPFLQLDALFRDAPSAIGWLQDHKTNLVFLDINMPNLSGLKFREIIGDELMIIFTTAYSEYAVESYEQNAIDYLLKPIQFPRFLQAVVKAKQYMGMRSPSEKPIALTDAHLNENTIYIKSGNKKYQLSTSEILFLEKDGNYIYFHLKDKKIMSRMTIQHALDILPEGQFIRIHKSWIISTKHIEVLEPLQVIINSIAIPIGQSFQTELLKLGN